MGASHLDLRSDLLTEASHIFDTKEKDITTFEMSRSLILTVLNDRSRTTIGDPHEGDYAVTIKLNEDDRDKLLFAFRQIGVHFTTVPWRPGHVFIHDVLCLERLLWFHLNTPVAEELERLVVAIEQRLEELEPSEAAA